MARKIVVSLVLVALVAGATHAASQTPSVVKLPGTYSSLSYNAEGGDLLGYEVRLIPARVGLLAVVQIAEGGAGEVFLVPVKQETADVVSFSIGSPGKKPAKVRGTVSEIGMDANIVQPSGESERVFLKRGASYWER
jgi:hypothetical protein